MSKFERVPYSRGGEGDWFHVSQRSVAALKPEPERDRIYYDDKAPGFGVRVTKGGVKSFVQNYYADQRQRRITIGLCSEMSADIARTKAEKIHREAREGIDPLHKREIVRAENTVADLAKEYLEKHALVKKREKSIYEDRRMIDKIITPKLGKKRVSVVEKNDVEALHATLRKTPYQANRTLALVSKMFTYSMERKWRTDNPCKGVERFHENERKVWLGEEQLQSFESALDSYSDQGAADALRLLVLTGARPHEVMGAEWNQFDLRRGTWTKPSHHTKQKEDSIIPVGDATMLILERMAKGRNGNSLPFLFPGRDGENARTTLRNAWAMVSRNAGLSVEYSVKGRRGKPLKRWKPKYRLYDLRHSYASHLVNRGQSLFLVGKLMGHTQAATTMKYAHAADSALRSVTNDFSKVIEMRPPKLA